MHRGEAVGFRALAFVGALAVWPGVASSAGDTIAITGGRATLNWDGSLTSFSISSADSQFVSEYYGGARAFNGGDTVDFSATIPVTNSGNHPISETYRGEQFPQSWVSGSLTIAATTFVAPHANGDGSTSHSFTTPFTMTGTVTAYATSDRTGTPLFSAAVTGSGTISAGPYRIIGDSYVLTDGGEIFTFTAPAPPQWQPLDVAAVGRVGYPAPAETRRDAR